ncbi:hypothetical protein P5673_018600 [Acropora cervicornis]|uniref:Uncharacterized protein n=1 Tax=Acropora cervicornis TaxID=6130 RepID=A0AAD9QCQ1_ACRCE|nr:hypothetical protein P5673_018600 [Acropora cervicornis]
MKRRTAIPLVQPREIGLSDAVVLTNAKIVDHLTPSAQELFAAAKSLNLSISQGTTSVQLLLDEVRNCISQEIRK